MRQVKRLYSIKKIIAKMLALGLVDLPSQCWQIHQVTHWAFMRSLPCVNSLMAMQMGDMSKFPATCKAHVWLFLLVKSLGREKYCWL